MTANCQRSHNNIYAYDLYIPVNIITKQSVSISTSGNYCCHTQLVDPDQVRQNIWLLKLFGSYTCLTADPGVSSLIPAWSHTFVEIDHEIISTVILLPSADSRRVVVSYK